MAAPEVLAGVRVLVTRPAHQAEALCALIERAGGIPVRFPTIEIAPPHDAAALERTIDRLDEFDMAIFVSPNAAQRAMPVVQARRGTLPAPLAVACVGPGSAKALAGFGVRGALVPERTDSEGLLALPALQQVAGRRILIFRGEGGRELLAETLAARGAIVQAAVCYRRLRPAADAAPLSAAFARGDIGVVTATSAEALRNLHELLAATARAALQRTPVAVASERLRQTCQTLGLHGPISVADSATDEAMIDAAGAAHRAWHEAQKTL